jgi:hypothetical protein
MSCQYRRREMDIDTIKKILKDSIKSAQADYDRTLKLFGERDPIVNYHEGGLTAYKILLKHIENN